MPGRGGSAGGAASRQPQAESGVQSAGRRRRLDPKGRLRTNEERSQNVLSNLNARS